MVIGNFPSLLFLIDGFTGVKRGNILIKAIELITETGASHQSITFDGVKVNYTMCTSLRSDFNSINPFIKTQLQMKNLNVF